MLEEMLEDSWKGTKKVKVSRRVCFLCSFIIPSIFWFVLVVIQDKVEQQDTEDEDEAEEEEAEGEEAEGEEEEEEMKVKAFKSNSPPTDRPLNG